MVSQRRRWAALICVLLWVAYAVVAGAAVSGKSATYDEPNHAAIGWLMLHRGDFRPSPDVPPLWEYWISLPVSSGEIHFDAGDPRYQNILPRRAACAWIVRLLYQTAGNDGLAVVQKCRVMAFIPSAMVGVLISAWAWKLAGPVAAVAATTLWALDPNLLGHGPLAKNDVVMGLVYGGLGMALWIAGRWLSWGSAICICLVVAVAPAIKLTGVVCGPVAALVLLCRAMMDRPWDVLRWRVNQRSGRVAAALAVVAAAGLAGYVILWASYGFRYSEAPAGLASNLPVIVQALGSHQVSMSGPANAFLVTAANYHWLPEAWITGCFLTELNGINLLSYLCGELYINGKWIYFPLAFLFKEPLATLAALMVTVAVVGVAIRAGRLKNNFDAQWAVVCMGIPIAVYVAALLPANMNIGVRYLFAVYPFLFVAAGWAAARLWQGGRIARGALIILGAGLAMETAAAYPDFISFFNVACGGEHGGLSLLSDSNLDWGQDLPALAAWQKRHPSDPLYLAYFGLCDPSAYGIRCTHVPGGYPCAAAPQWPSTGGVAAISATFYQQAAPGSFASYFHSKPPDEVLGGSIYLFRFTQPPPVPVSPPVPAAAY